jgi:putative DNA primase/helicase
MIPQSLVAATSLAKAGFAVVPTLSRSRDIRVLGWPDLQLTEDELSQHFTEAEQNISINWKHSNSRCAVDCDALEAEELAALLLPPDTPAFGRSGRLRQVVFECAEATSFSLIHKQEMLVEVLAGGRASLAPGSIQPNGDTVQWCEGRSPQEYPPKKTSFEWLQRMANIVAGAALVLRHLRDVAGRGVRHDTTLKLAGAMLHAGWEPSTVRHVLQAIFRKAPDPELKDRQAAIETTIRRQQDGQPFSGLPELAKVLAPELTATLVRFWNLGKAVPDVNIAVPGVPGTVLDELVLTWASNIRPERIVWDCYGLLAPGKTTLLAGDPGCGKSTIAAHFTACYSNGTAFPGSTTQRAPRMVLVAAAEDGAADTKVPRLLAAGADLSKVAFMDLVQAGVRQRYFTLADVPALNTLLSKYPGEFGLLIIDPIGAYMGGRDSHRDSDVRELLRPLTVLAEKHAIAVLLIAHLNKNSMQQAMSRITGAKAFVAAARLAWLVAKDPHDPNDGLMVQLKTNITEPLEGFSYQIQKEELPGGVETSKIIWNDLPVQLTADEVLQRRPPSDAAPERQQQAEQWLLQRLAAGPVAVRVLREETDLQPFSMDTVKRAAKALGIRGEGEKKSRVWMLPTQILGSIVQVDFGTPRRTTIDDLPAKEDT